MPTPPWVWPPLWHASVQAEPLSLPVCSPLSSVLPQGQVSFPWYPQHPAQRPLLCKYPLELPHSLPSDHPGMEEKSLVDIHTIARVISLLPSTELLPRS